MIYQDDVCVGVSTKEKLKHKIEKILKKLNETGMTINKDKYKVNYGKVSYLGYQI